MELVYAFTDEYGAFGWDIQNPSVSTHFIITAIIIIKYNPFYVIFVIYNSYIILSLPLYLNNIYFLFPFS